MSTRSTDERIQQLESLSDEQLYQRFWELTTRLVQPLVEHAYHHTSPSIERSVLLRMGFSSLEAATFVERCVREGCLGQGAGAILVNTARARGISYRAAYDQLLALDDWRAAGVVAS